MNMDNVLVVAAHPDDDILGCGATMHKLIRNGKFVRVVFLGEGTTCRFTEDQRDSEEARRTIEQRADFARAALGVIGVKDFAFYNLPCGSFDTVPIIRIAALVEEEIAFSKPDTILTHFTNDTNNDHRLTFQATLQATRPGALNFVKNILSFEVLSSTEWRFTEVFKPNFFVNTEADIATKIEALDKYETEQRPFPFPRSPEGLAVQSKMRGMQVGLRDAEAFSIVRSVEL
jgi:LmbE family N-acetylglucosaminyl deacetylase